MFILINHVVQWVTLIECIGSAREWFDIAGFFVTIVVNLLTAYDLKTLFVESFWVQLPLRRHREVQPVENNNSLLSQVTLDLKKGINSCSIQSCSLLARIVVFPSASYAFL